MGRASPGTVPHFSHNILYCSVRQSDSIGSAQKLDNMRNRYCFFFWVSSVTKALRFILTKLCQSRMEHSLSPVSMVHCELAINRDTLHHAIWSEPSSWRLQ